MEEAYGGKARVGSMEEAYGGKARGGSMEEMYGKENHHNSNYKKGKSIKGSLALLVVAIVSAVYVLYFS